MEARARSVGFDADVRGWSVIDTMLPSKLA
jgi:hypothetical protein